MALLKALGGLGLKSIFVFSKPLEAKSRWWLLNTTGLWIDVIWHKYISPSSIMDWIRPPWRVGREIYCIWKEVMDALDVIRPGLAWNIGKGFRIGWDSWIGSGMDHILPPDLVDCLEQDDVLFISQVGNPLESTIHHQGWKSGESLGLDVDQGRIWDNYLGALRRAHIQLSYTKDSLVWMLSADWIYRPKEGYIALCMDRFVIDPKWWWQGIWKLHCPTKSKLL